MLPNRWTIGPATRGTSSGASANHRVARCARRATATGAAGLAASGPAPQPRPPPWGIALRKFSQTLQTDFHERPGRPRDSIPSGGTARFVGQGHRFNGVGPQERRAAAAGHALQDAPERPDVGGGAGSAGVHRLFRGHEPRRAQDRPAVSRTASRRPRRDARPAGSGASDRPRSGGGRCRNR